MLSPTPAVYSRVWDKARALTMAPAHPATPLLRRPYDLRHSDITWRLNSGVPPTEIAAWAGHSIERVCLSNGVSVFAV